MKLSALAIQATVLAVATALVAARPAAAGTLTVTNQNTPVVVNSDAGSVIATPFIVTDGLAAAIKLDSLGTLSSAYDALNPGDTITGISFDNDISGNGVGNCYVGEVLASSASCTIELLISVTGVAPTLAEPQKMGVSYVYDTGISSNIYGEPAVTQSADGEFLTDVQYAPEPSSLLLLGSGLFTLAGAAYRKRQSLRS